MSSGILASLPAREDLDARRKEKAAVMGDAPFTAIERKINDLAGMVAALKKEKDELSAVIARKSAEAKELEEKVAELTRERNEIRNRVETILSRLESIEL
jgi:peptidoglycan hydrolase CwlO-like protein